MSSPAEVMFTESAEWQLLAYGAAPTPDDILPLLLVNDVAPTLENTLPQLEPAMPTEEFSVYLEPVTPTIKFDAHFRTLVRDWKRDTSHLSLISQRIIHPAYKQILGMGKTALPLVLAELSVEPDHWFHALTLLANDDPIPPGFCGTVSEAAELWVNWGRSQNLIPDATERAVPYIP